MSTSQHTRRSCSRLPTPNKADLPEEVTGFNPCEAWTKNRNMLRVRIRKTSASAKLFVDQFVIMPNPNVLKAEFEQ